MNGKQVYFIGAAVLALLVIFSLIGGNPVMMKTDFAEFKKDVKENFAEIKGDIKGLRIYMERISSRRERGD